MGTYLGVNAVKKFGKAAGSAPERQPEVPVGHRLVAIINNGLWQIAPDVTSPQDYQNMYRSYSGGHWLTAELYHLPKSLVAQCPDEGRVSI